MSEQSTDLEARARALLPSLTEWQIRDLRKHADKSSGRRHTYSPAIAHTLYLLGLIEHPFRSSTWLATELGRAVLALVDAPPQAAEPDPLAALRAYYERIVDGANTRLVHTRKGSTAAMVGEQAEQTARRCLAMAEAAIAPLVAELVEARAQADADRAVLRALMEALPMCQADECYQRATHGERRYSTDPLRPTACSDCAHAPLEPLPTIYLRALEAAEARLSGAPVAVPVAAQSEWRTTVERSLHKIEDAVSALEKDELAALAGDPDYFPPAELARIGAFVRGGAVIDAAELAALRADRALIAALAPFVCPMSTPVCSDPCMCMARRKVAEKAIEARALALAAEGGGK